MISRNKTLMIMMATSLTLVVGCTTSAGGHKQAKLLSAQLTMVAEAGDKFRKVRDKVAKARLYNMQSLSNSLLEVQESNSDEFELWNFFDRKQSIKLFNWIVLSTDRIAEQRAAREATLLKQAKELKKRQSAININKSEMIKAANQIAKLGEEADSKERSKQYFAFAKDIIGKVKEASVDAAEASDSGMQLLNQKIEKQSDENE